MADPTRWAALYPGLGSGLFIAAAQAGAAGDLLVAFASLIGGFVLVGGSLRRMRAEHRKGEIR